MPLRIARGHWSITDVLATKKDVRAVGMPVRATETSQTALYAGTIKQMQASLEEKDRENR